MIDPVNPPFGDTFVFTRFRPARYRDSDGLKAIAVIGAPRFDHRPDGRPRGLLVEGRPQTRFADRLSPRAGAWAVDGGTVLHEYETPDGEVRATAWYAPVDPQSAVAGCLNLKGWHRLIAYVPGYLKNRDGYVLWRRRQFNLGGLIATDPGAVLSSNGKIIMLEG